MRGCAGLVAIAAWMALLLTVACTSISDAPTAVGINMSGEPDAPSLGPAAATSVGGSNAAFSPAPPAEPAWLPEAKNPAPGIAEAVRTGAEPTAVENSGIDILERGGASWYGIRFHNRRTANGERFDMAAMTAAHRTLPFGTLVCVHSLVNGGEVLVRINDRGPHTRDRIIDLSRSAAQALGMIGLGIKQVALSVPERTGRSCKNTPLALGP